MIVPHAWALRSTLLFEGEQSHLFEFREGAMDLPDVAIDEPGDARHTGMCGLAAALSREIACSRDTMSIRAYVCSRSIALLRARYAPRCAR